MMMRPPQVDSTTLMRLAEASQAAPLFQAVLRFGLPSLGWFDSWLVSRRDSPAVQQEFANKLTVIQFVTRGPRPLGLDPAADEPLTALVERTLTLETFPRVWALEGLGRYWADRASGSAATDPVGLLADPTLPPWSLAMLHAGMGASHARTVLGGLGATPADAQVRGAIARFLKICRDSSRPGYTGAALESFGLMARTLYPTLMPALDREIPAVDLELHAYFWHGAGRAMYFDPLNLLPSVNAPWRPIARLAQEAPHEIAYANALAGIAWALTLVNMRQPAVIEAFLRHHGNLAATNDAFVNGVTSALVLRYDTTRDDSGITPFVHHQSSDAAVAAAWRALVAGPCEEALRGTYGELIHSASIETLFRYRAPVA